MPRHREESRGSGRRTLHDVPLPKQHWKNIRTTNAIERLNGEFRRRVKTQGSLPSEDSALVLLYGLVATGQIRLRKIDGFRKLAGVISAQARNAA